MIRRPAHGATRRPPVERPGSGFGRPIRPRPPRSLRNPDVYARLCVWDPVELLYVNTHDDAALTS